MCYFYVVLEVGEHWVVGVVAEHEWFHDYDLAVGLCFCVFEHVAAVVFVFFDLYAFLLLIGVVVTEPEVVDAYHYA